MAKVGGSYDSIVLGVSEQVATDRRQGQHELQVNYISDPVRGLARRWGSLFQHERFLREGGVGPTIASEHGRMREYSFTIAGVDYCLIYRPFATATGSEHFCYAYNKTTGQFLPVVLQSSTFVNQLVSGGVSAVANVGNYLYIAGNDTRATVVQTNVWDGTNRTAKVVWVRGGAYARTYRVRLLRDDGTTYVEATYKTMSSGYDYDLDTNPSKPPVPVSPPSGASQADIDKFQNDSLAWNNYYNKASSAHIVAAAQDITPENIAEKLRLALVAAGIPASGTGRIGGTIVLSPTGFRDVTTDDGGDNSTMLGVGQEVASLDKLSSLHYVGKIVRVRPRGAQQKEAFYVKAYAKNEGATGWQEVIWREAAGVEQTWSSMWAQGVIYGGTLYIAQDATGLTAIAPGSGPHPQYKNSEVGDGASSPIPYFAGKRITMLATFQDRLLVGSDGTVNASRPGDYLNFYRQSVLDIRDDDPVEMYAHGAEGDVLRSHVIFDKDMILFGDQKQYAISGRVILTPRNPNIAVMSAHEDSTQAQPSAGGNLVFYGKQREGRTSVHQIQVRQLAESPESVEISGQLDTFLNGRPAQVVSLTSPNTLVFRTEAKLNSLYVYNYIDRGSGAERVFDAWSRWDYSDLLGTICAVSSYKGELLVFTLRAVPGSVYICCDKQSLSTELSPRPYMDSLKPYTTPGGSHGSIPVDETLIWCVALDNRHESFLFGDSLNNAPQFLEQIPDGAPYLWLGVPTDSVVTPTNPFVRDQNGKTVVEGRLTLTHVTLSLANTAGLEVSVQTINGTKDSVDYNARILSRSDNVVGQQPVITDKLLVSIGAESRECTYTIRSRQWMPSTITAISWAGQYFNRVRRVS